MPELKGFENQGDSTVALIDFPQARKHIAQPDGSFVAIANPHTRKMDQATVNTAISTLDGKGEDSSFYVGVKERMQAYVQQNVVLNDAGQPGPTAARNPAPKLS